MIKTSDLRAGNLFEIQGIGNFPVVDFSCDFTGKLHQVRFLSSLVFHRDRVPSETIETIIPELWQVKPIPLSAEWLKEFGFSPMPALNRYAKSGNWRKSLDNAGNEMQFDDRQDYGLFSYNGCILWKSPKYVHQLQSLFQALTGEELTLKEIA